MTTRLFFLRIYTPFHDADKPGTDTGTKVWQSFANAFILLGVVIVMTVILLLLYKYKCYKVSLTPMIRCVCMPHSLKRQNAFGLYILLHG